MTTTLGAPTPTSTTSAPRAGAAPRRPEGLELLGQFRGSGAQHPPCLVRRADGQVVQLSPLVYAVLEALDGRRGSVDVAALASASTGREIDAAGVRYLVEHKLLPLGLVDVGGPAAHPPTADPLLAIRGRTPVLSARTTGALAVALQPLFRTPVVVAALVALAALDAWVLLVRDLGDGVRQLAADPALALAVLGLTIAAAVFHELGHAAACRFGGATPGVIGMGLYLVYPAFYTDVTDTYRLDRAGRVRTDLGGLHFHALAVLAIGGAYAVTGAEWLLLAVVLVQLEMLQQLLPLVRFDGYYVLADLVGVPDLFARIGPVLRGALHRDRPQDPRVAGLKRWVRFTVTAWVAVVVPFLAVSLAMLVWHLPRLLGTLGASAARAADACVDALAADEVARAVGEGVNALLLLLVLAGLTFVVQAVGRRAWGAARRATAGRPRRRAAVAGASALVLVVLVISWAATGQLSAR